VDRFVLLSLGTGVGGGIVVDGKVLEGAHSHGGEIGHLRIDLPDKGRLCPCGRRGCLEAYASGTAVVARTREDVAAFRGPTRMRGLLEKKGKELEAKDVFAAAADGDPVA